MADGPHLSLPHGKRPSSWRYACCFALVVAWPCVALDRHYTGVAYTEDGKQVSYREEHWLFDDQGTRTRLVLYRCSTGQAFARKWVHYTGPAATPEFDFIDARDGYREGVHHTAGGLQVYTQKGDQAAADSAELKLREGAVVDAGFDAYVQEHWAELSRSGGMRAAFVVPSRLSYMDLKLAVVDDDGQQRHLRMSLAGWLGAVAPTVDLIYTTSDHHLLSFQGISNIRDNSGHRQRVRIEFSASDELAAPSPSDIQTAAGAPLTAHCPS
jgi:hypothetical protein